MVEGTTPSPRTAQPSGNRARAMRLLRGAALGGHLGAVVVTVLFFFLRGVNAGLSCAIACAVTLAFYAIGQAVQVIVADSPPMTVLVAAMVSYGSRVGVLGGLLALGLSQASRLNLDPIAVLTGTISVVVCWLAAEIFVFSRLRIPVFEPRSANR